MLGNLLLFILLSNWRQTEGALIGASCVNYHPSRAPHQLNFGTGFIYHGSQLVCELTYDQSTILQVSDVQFPQTVTLLSLTPTLWRLEFQISATILESSLIVLTDTIFSDFDIYVDSAQLTSVRLVYANSPPEPPALKNAREEALVSKYANGIRFRLSYNQRIADSLGGNLVMTVSTFRVKTNSGNFLFSPSQLTVVDQNTLEFPIDLTTAVGTAATSQFKLECVANDELKAEEHSFTFDTVAPSLVSVTALPVTQEHVTVNVVWSKAMPLPEYSLTISLVPPEATCGTFQIVSDTNFNFRCSPATTVSQKLKLDISASALARDLPGNFADQSASSFKFESLIVFGPPSQFLPVEVVFVRSVQYPKEYGDVSGTSGNNYGDLEIAWQSAVTAVSYDVTVQGTNEFAAGFQTIHRTGLTAEQTSVTVPLTEDSQIRLGGNYKVTLMAADFFQQTYQTDIPIQHSPVIFELGQGEIVLPDISVGTEVWQRHPEISIDRVSVVTNTEDTAVYAALSSTLEVLGVRTWTSSETNDPCVFNDEQSECSNYRVHLYHAFDETNNVLLAPLRLRFEFSTNMPIPSPYLPQLKQWEPLLSTWTGADEFCTQAESFNNYNRKFVYEISVCKLGGFALFFHSSPELSTGGEFESEIPPSPFTVGQPTMTCILFIGITLLLTGIIRFSIWTEYLRRATRNRELALREMQAPQSSSFAAAAGSERDMLELSLETQVEVTRSRRAQAGVTGSSMH